MVRAPLVCILALATAACAATSTRLPTVSEAQLLSGDVFDVSSAPVLVSREDALALDADMRAFVTAYVGDSRSQEAVLHKLLEGMKGVGLLSLDYTQYETRTASTAFHDRRGNCLSFTLLFVALAREAGLDVAFQIVEVPPTWINQSDLVVVGNHINALVNLPHGTDYVVDFNATDLRTQYPEYSVSDDYAIALFYNNLGAEALLRREYELSFQYFRAALTTGPSVAAAWANFGLLYARVERPAYAEAAYLEALERSPGQRTALTNLVSLYESVGENELAARYRERIRSYQERNPYYHYALAQDAFSEHRFEDALTAVNRAVRLKRDEHEFYDLKARVLLELGKAPKAAENFVRARDYADSNETRAEYEARLRSLTIVPGTL